jgi:hypothetical protein
MIKTGSKIIFDDQNSRILKNKMSFQRLMSNSRGILKLLGNYMEHLMNKMPDLSIFKTKIKTFVLKTVLHVLKHLFIIVSCCLPITFVGGQSFQGQARFIENKGQWPELVQFKLALNVGTVYFEENGLRFDLINPEDLEQHDRHRMGIEIRDPELLDADSFRAFNFFVAFKNVSNDKSVSGDKPLSGRFNYFLGSNPENWASNAKAYSEVVYKNLYQGIENMI